MLQLEILPVFLLESMKTHIPAFAIKQIQMPKCTFKIFLILWYVQWVLKNVYFYFLKGCQIYFCVAWFKFLVTADLIL